MRWIPLLLVLTACGGPAAIKGHQPDQDARHGEHHHGMPHRFEDPIKWEKIFEDPERDVWQRPDEVVTHMAIEPGMTVADIGAGTGYLLERLARAAGPEGRVLALDVEASLVEHMKARVESGGEAWKTVEARKVPFDDPQLAAESTHRIVILDTWHHIGDREVYAGKLREALAPDGRVFIVDFTLDSPHGPPAKHRLVAEQVIAELEAGGLKAGVVEESLPNQYIVVGHKPSP